MKLCGLTVGTSVIEEPTASVFRVDVVENGGLCFSEILVNTIINSNLAESELLKVVANRTVKWLNW